MKTTGTNPDIPIIYEDNHLLVVDKPAGVLSQEDRTGKPDLLTLCREYLKKEYGKPGNVFLGLLHRLDKPVSGVIMFAKTSKSASRISEQIRKRKIGKTYLTVVTGKPPENGFLDHYLLKDEKKNLVTVVERGIKRAKHSQLIFQTLEQRNNLALLKVKLITGRAHQIRVQFSTEGFPVWGDEKYGKAEANSIALHAYELTIEHPTLKKEKVFTAHPPNQKPWNGFKTKIKS
ncbi:MAG: RluA family pseudouridine synthase [Balneolaceae bacterium]